jgi:hypothetical protein
VFSEFRLARAILLVFRLARENLLVFRLASLAKRDSSKFTLAKRISSRPSLAKRISSKRPLAKRDSSRIALARRDPSTDYRPCALAIPQKQQLATRAQMHSVVSSTKRYLWIMLLPDVVPQCGRLGYAINST